MSNSPVVERRAGATMHAGSQLSASAAIDPDGDDVHDGIIDHMLLYSRP